MVEPNVRPATPDDMADVARLCRAYRDLLVARSGDLPAHMIDNYYPAAGYEALIADLPRIHARPAGDILVARLDGATVGCAMYHARGGDDTCEIKRIFVDASARGTGTGRALIRAAMDDAANDGYTRMVLDTMVTLTEAIALYETLGFTPCAPFYDPDPALRPYLKFYEIDL